MSLFKHRPNRLKYLSNVRTLHEVHCGQMASFAEKQKSLAGKRDRLDQLTKDLKKIETERRQGFSTEDIKSRSAIRSEMEVLKDEIFKIENNYDLKEYLGTTGDILLDYYNMTSGAFYNIKTDDSVGNNSPKRSDIYKSESEHPQGENTIQPDNKNDDKRSDDISDNLIKLNLFSQSKRKVKKPVKKRKIVYETPTNKTIMGFFATDPTENTVPVVTINRATLQDEYLMLIDKNYACDHIRSTPIKICTACGIEKTLHQNEGAYVCQQCGEAEHVIIESEIPSHKDAINEKPKYPYKKLNHLKEKLNQLQAKETADIPDRVFDIIAKELKKKRTIAKRSTPPMIKDILKKHKLTDYYEHLQQIYCKVSSAQPVTITRDDEEDIINKFNKMQDAYQKHRPEKRSNFLNYSYVLNKLFRIKGMDNYAKYFGLLKSKDKLREQDAIWSKICKDMGWKYHPSI